MFFFLWKFVTDFLFPPTQHNQAISIPFPSSSRKIYLFCTSNLQCSVKNPCVFEYKPCTPQQKIISVCFSSILLIFYLLCNVYQAIYFLYKTGITKKNPHFFHHHIFLKKMKHLHLLLYIFFSTVVYIYMNKKRAHLFPRLGDSKTDFSRKSQLLFIIKNGKCIQTRRLVMYTKKDVFRIRSETRQGSGAMMVKEAGFGCWMWSEDQNHKYNM